MCYSCTYLIIITSELIFIVFSAFFFFKPFLRNKIDPMPLISVRKWHGLPLILCYELNSVHVNLPISKGDGWIYFDYCYHSQCACNHSTALVVTFLLLSFILPHFWHIQIGGPGCSIHTSLSVGVWDWRYSGSPCVTILATVGIFWLKQMTYPNFIFRVSWFQKSLVDFWELWHFRFMTISKWRPRKKNCYWENIIKRHYLTSLLYSILVTSKITPK
jgi:hypothetical protein